MRTDQPSQVAASRVVPAPVSLPAAVPLPAPVPARIDLRLVLALGAVWLIWGSTYLAMRVAVARLPAFGMAGTRFVLAGGALLVIVRVRGEPLPSRRAWLVAVPVGALLFLCGNGLVVVAEQTLPSSVAAIVCATTPLVASVRSASRAPACCSVSPASVCSGWALRSPWRGGARCSSCSRRSVGPSARSSRAANPHGRAAPDAGSARRART